MTDDVSNSNDANPTAEVISIIDPANPRKIDTSLLDLAALKAEIGGMIDALGEIRWSLPTLLFGAGGTEISIDHRARLAEMVRTSGESVRLTLEAARTLFELVPDATVPTEAEPTADADAEDPAPIPLADWRAAMSRRVERVADLSNKVLLLRAMQSDTSEWANGLAQLLLDVELVGKSAAASLPVYDDPAEDADLYALHADWCRLRAASADLQGDDALDEWTLAMAQLVNRLMLAPAWTAAGRRLKFEVFRAELVLAAASERFGLDERAGMWLAALEVDATRRVA